MYAEVISSYLLYTGDQPLLPLWGQICCNIMAEPTCSTQPRSTGFIHLQVCYTLY